LKEQATYTGGRELVYGPLREILRRKTYHRTVTGRRRKEKNTLGRGFFGGGEFLFSNRGKTSSTGWGVLITAKTKGSGGRSEKKGGRPGWWKRVCVEARGRNHWHCDHIRGA